MADRGVQLPQSLLSLCLVEKKDPGSQRVGLRQGLHE